MRGNRLKIQIAMARACISFADLVQMTGMPAQTVKNVICGQRSVKPVTIGKVARALNVDVTEILLDQ